MKILFTILMVLMVASIGSAAPAFDVEECSWFWTTSFASATEDAPDAIYCRQNYGQYYLMPSTHAQLAAGADDVTITWDTDIADGSTTIGDLLTGVTNTTAICSNSGATVSLNVHASANNSQFSEGGVYYYQAASLADEDANTFGMTPIRHFKLTATEASGTAACMVAHSTVSWIKR